MRSLNEAGVVRFGVSMNRHLLKRFDRYARERGYANRSEALRDLIRRQLVEASWAAGDGQVAGAVVLVYDHHRSGVPEALTELQHRHLGVIVAATHVHLDESRCLEVVILRGQAAEARAVAERLLTVRGLEHGRVLVAGGGDRQA